MSYVRVGISLYPSVRHLARISIAQNERLRWHQPRKGSEGYKTAMARHGPTSLPRDFVGYLVRTLAPILRRVGAEAKHCWAAKEF